LRALQEEGLALSMISRAELYEGVYASRDPEGTARALQNVLRGVTLLPVDERTCQMFGRERGRLRAAGLRIGDVDLRIGATALQHELTLLTNNRRHFERLDGLDIASLP
jgi:tRNA(fMet)-specific endonuclease VapC